MNDEIPDGCDAIDVPGCGRIVIHPISYKKAKEFRTQAAQIIGVLTAGPPAVSTITFDEAVSDLLDKCCVPNLTTLDDLPLTAAAEIYARWIKLNFSGDKYDFTVALLEEVIQKLVGQKLSLKTIWSRCVSPLGILAPILNGASASAGLTSDGPIPSSLSDLPLPKDSSFGNVPQRSPILH